MVKKKKKRDKKTVTFELLTEFYHEFIRPDLKNIEKKVDRNSQQIQVNTKKIEDNSKKIDNNARKIDDNARKIEVNTTKLDKLDDQFDGLKAEFSDTPSRKEFAELEDRVERCKLHSFCFLQF